MGAMSHQPWPPARFFKMWRLSAEGSRRANHRPLMSWRLRSLRPTGKDGDSTSANPTSHVSRMDNNLTAFAAWRLPAASHTSHTSHTSHFRRLSFMPCFLSCFTSRLASVSLCSFFISILTLTLFLSSVPSLAGSVKHCSVSSSFTSLPSWPGVQPVGEAMAFSPVATQAAAPFRIRTLNLNRLVWSCSARPRLPYPSSTDVQPELHLMALPSDCYRHSLENYARSLKLTVSTSAAAAAASTSAAAVAVIPSDSDAAPGVVIVTSKGVLSPDFSGALLTATVPTAGDTVSAIDSPADANLDADLASDSNISTPRKCLTSGNFMTATVAAAVTTPGAAATAPAASALPTAAIPAALPDVTPASATSGPAFSQQQLTRPVLNPRPGKINKIAFWAFAANLDPETAARFRSQILKPAAPAGAGQDSSGGAIANAAGASAASAASSRDTQKGTRFTDPAIAIPASEKGTARTEGQSSGGAEMLWAAGQSTGQEPLPQLHVSLQPFFSGSLDSSGRDALAAELKSKFSLQLVQLLRQGTFVLTWESAAAASSASTATGAATGDEALTQIQSQPPTRQPQKNPRVTTRRLTLPHVESPLVGFFYDESEALSMPEASFYTYDGKRHRVWLTLPSASLPPGYEVNLLVYQSPYTPEKEPFLDEKRPETGEFSGKIELTASGSYLVALIAPDDAAYFLCFRALAVDQDYDLSSLTPVLISRAEPVYPEAARKKRATGRVKLQAKTGPDGHVNRIRILESVDPVLTRAAVEAVSQWVYSLPEFEGRKISYVFSMTLDFKLSPPDIR